MIPLDNKSLSLVSSRKNVYSKAVPFPHVVIDDFLPPSVLDAVVDEFPDLDDEKWHRFDDSTGKKYATTSATQLPPKARELVQELNSSAFLSALEELTGIAGLIPDPHLDGGGLHQITSGGFLKIHADFNWNDRLKLDRRINLLIFLSRNWNEEYGGHLELWNPSMTGCVQRILPLFNRCVIFETTDRSFHGHPDPLTCPSDMTRKSLALYYYTRGRPQHEISSIHSTLYQERDNERFKPGLSFLGAIKMFTPPILIRAYRHLLKR